jgi:hypothetical protein
MYRAISILSILFISFVFRMMATTTKLVLTSLIPKIEMEIYPNPCQQNFR